MNIFRKLYSRVELIVWIPLLILIIAATIEYGILFPNIRAFPGPICTTFGALIVIANMNAVMRTLTNSGYKDSAKRAWRRLLGIPTPVYSEAISIDIPIEVDCNATVKIADDTTLEQKVEFLLLRIDEVQNGIWANRQELKSKIQEVKQTAQEDDQRRKEQIWILEDKVRKAFLDGVQWQIFGVLLAVWGTCFNLIFPAIG